MASATPRLPLDHDAALQHRRQSACEASNVRLSDHTWPRRSARPMSASRGSPRSAALQLCLLQASSTSAGPPILYGRIRPMAGALPQGTEQCIDARPLRSQRHGSFWCSERGVEQGGGPPSARSEGGPNPQASGVRARRRPVEYPTVADAVIKAKTCDVGHTNRFTCLSWEPIVAGTYTTSGEQRV